MYYCPLLNFFYCCFIHNIVYKMEIDSFAFVKKSIKAVVCGHLDTWWIISKLIVLFIVLSCKHHPFKTDKTVFTL